MQMKEFLIKVPASSANLGPGFDALGIGLNLYLEIRVRIDPSVDTSLDSNHAQLSYEGHGTTSVSLKSEKNLVTQTALYVMRCNGIGMFPQGTQIYVNNPIPLGRGLGSSGAAVVGGAMLGNEIGGFKLSKERLLDYCLLIERHPDNIAAAMIGGFVGSFINDLFKEDHVAASFSIENILPTYPTTKGENEINQPPIAIGLYLKYKWNDKIRCIAVIPDFEVKTNDSRAVLPMTYERKDVIFNLQRLAVLITVLAMDPPNHKMIYESMKDRIHQPYRAQLIPGLSFALQNLTTGNVKGLCGICLSGAGPTILCLATENFAKIAESVVGIFEKNNIKCTWKFLDLASDGAIVEHLLE